MLNIIISIRLTSYRMQQIVGHAHAWRSWRRGGVVSIAELITKVRTVKISSGTSGGIFTKVCTSENFPLYSRYGVCACVDCLDKLTSMVFPHRADTLFGCLLFGSLAKLSSTRCAAKPCGPVHAPRKLWISLKWIASVKSGWLYSKFNYLQVLLDLLCMCRATWLCRVARSGYIVQRRSSS